MSSASSSASRSASWTDSATAPLLWLSKPTSASGPVLPGGGGGVGGLGGHAATIRRSGAIHIRRRDLHAGVMAMLDREGTRSIPSSKQDVSERKPARARCYSA